MPRTMKLIATVAVLGGIAGCDDATAPAAGHGQVEVAAVGDAEPSSASQSTAGPSSSASGDDGSTIEFRARVWLRTETGGWVEVTQGAAGAAEVSAAAGAASATFASARMDARSYTRVRVVFEEVRAHVGGSAELGVGGVVQGEVLVGAEGSTEPATVEREVTLTVGGGATSRITIDLNADAWLDGADAETRTVSRSEFESAVRIVAD